MPHPVSFSRSWILLFGIVLGVIALGVELFTVLPYALSVWHPYDFRLYVEMGTAARQGINPVGPQHYYPLPTVLWIFVPLSLMPDWFRIVWVIVPFAFILMLHRANGIAFLLFPPFWFNVADAMLDGWLLFPLKWLVENRPVFAGIGAVILLTKPQLAILPVGYMFLCWVARRDWKNITAFTLGLIVLCLPAFIFDPLWMIHLAQVLPQRADESMSLLPLLTSSVWAWWWLGGVARIVGVAILVGAIVLAAIALRRQGNVVAILQSLNQLLVPILFASNLAMLIPILRTRRAIFTIVSLALAAWALDNALGGFGGGYAFVPLALLFFCARDFGAVNSEAAR